MVQPLILEGNPFIADTFRKSARTLLEDTGGNTGNLAFRHAVNMQVRGGRQMSWGSGVDTIRGAGDVIVLPLANQLGKHTDLGTQADLMKAVGLPVIGVGLGAQASKIGDDIQLTEGTLRWLATLADLAPAKGSPSIGVRGEYTRQQIEKLGFADLAIVTGCPSNFINLDDDIAARVAERFGRTGGSIAVTAGIPHIPHLAGLERQLADIVTLTDGAYIVQHALGMVQIARNEFDGMGEDALALTQNYIQPHMSRGEFIAWCRRYAYALLDIRYWMDFVQRFDFVVGTRFHGVMIAIQAGIPAGCIAHDSRTFEMCQTMAIPVCKASDITGPVTRHNVRDLFAFDPDRYRETRRTLARNYLTVADAAGVQLSRALTTFAA